MIRTRLAAPAALLLLLPLAGACERGAEPPEDAPVDGSAVDGLTPEQLRQRAEPMSPEEAEALGIVDTTIYMEQLTSPGDSALLSDSLPAAARDTGS